MRFLRRVLPADRNGRIFTKAERRISLLMRSDGVGNRFPVWSGFGVPHEIAKLLLEHTTTFLDRTEAIKQALGLGMPLNEIEAYLDWLDSFHNPPPSTPDTPPATEEEKPEN